MGYARGLYDSAKQEEAEETVYSLTKDLIRVFSENDKMKMLLAHPLMAKSEKKALLLSILDKYDCPIFVKFIDFPPFKSSWQLHKRAIRHFADCLHRHSHLPG